MLPIYDESIDDERISDKVNEWMCKTLYLKKYIFLVSFLLEYLFFMAHHYLMDPTQQA